MSEFWAIKQEGFGFLCGTYVTKKDAIRCLMQAYHGINKYDMTQHSLAMKHWRKLKKHGFSAVKVTVAEAKPNGETNDR